jgi:peptide deformylase
MGKINIVIDQKILTTPSQDINILEYEEVFRQLEENVIEHSGVGLAAIQINIPKRAFVVSYEGKVWYFANSVILSRELPQKDTEGCLSIPGRQFEVRRPTHIKVKDDINGEQEYSGMLARIIQHEHDHTMGKTLIQTGKLV